MVDHGKIPGADQLDVLGFDLFWIYHGEFLGTVKSADADADADAVEGRLE